MRPLRRLQPVCRTGFQLFTSRVGTGELPRQGEIPFVAVSKPHFEVITPCFQLFRGRSCSRCSVPASTRKVQLCMFLFQAGLCIQYTCARYTTR